MYKYLLFDIDGTIYDFEHDKDIAFRHMYAASGLESVKPLTDELFALYDTCNMAWWKKFENKLCTKAELFNNRFVDFFAAADLPYMDPDVLNKLFFDALGETATYFPGAEAMLKTLMAHYDIYIVTNGNASSQMTRMEISGLTKYIKGYFISETAGAAKPDKRYFDYVLSGIPGAKSEDSIVIGDSISSDMRGAVNANMDSIWFNPHHDPNPANVPVTHEVSSFEEILRILLPGDTKC